MTAVVANAVGSSAYGSRQLRLAAGLAAFAVVLTGFLLVPPFLTGDVGAVRGFTWQEAADLLTPLAAMPLAAILVELTGRSGLRVRLVLVALIAIWVEGHGIHLGANAIGDVFPAGADRHAFYLTAPGPLDHFLDEDLGHWLWHAAWLGLLALLLWAAATGPTDRPEPARATLLIAAAAGVVHGFTWFVVTDEGGTWLLAIPASLVLLSLAWLVRRHDGGFRVVTQFLAASSIITLVLYAAWIALVGFPPVGFCERIGC